MPPGPGVGPPPGFSGGHPGGGSPGAVGWVAPGFYTGARGVRHRPGVGAVVAFLGLVLIVVSLFGLPWVSEGGQDVSFPDIRESFEAAQDAGLAGTADNYLEFYLGGLWILVLGMTAAAVVVSTLFVPRTTGNRIVLGFLVGGVVGAIVMAVDKEGTAGPRVCGALLTAGAATVHGFALSEFFDDAGVSPAYGVWTGIAGFAVLFVGCLIGTNVERSPTYA